MKIPKPTGRMVEETVHRTLIVWINGQYVVYTYQRAQISLSITGDHPGDNHPEQGRIPGDLAVQADVTCGGGSDWVTTHGPPSGIALVQEAIPDLYAGLSDTEERAALRSIHRRLTKLARAARMPDRGTGVLPMSLPTRPSDIPHNVPLRDLVVTYDRHTLRIVEHRHGIGDPLTTEQRLDHALAALAYQYALAERALHSRWSIATDALAAGATLRQVGAAMGGLDADRVRYSLRWWVDYQHQEGLMDDARYDEVLQLAARKDGAR